jgi:hypothetical protein
MPQGALIQAHPSESQQIGTPPGIADLVICRPFFVVVCATLLFDLLELI